MLNIILRPNASPIYNFLTYIENSRKIEGEVEHRKILDCGAGGPIPPLVLFYQNGFECTGIDISANALELADGFCLKNEIPAKFIHGDMREMPFNDSEFDFVYEHYSMCHLTKSETGKAVTEMNRVLKSGGLAYLGVISDDTWPILGKETSPGEWIQEENDSLVTHSFFTDDEADNLVSDWEVLQKEKRVLWRTNSTESMGRKEWADMYSDISDGTTGEQWMEYYIHRHRMFQNTHIYYILKKIN